MGLQFGHSAYFKKKSTAKKFAKKHNARVRKTKHFTRGDGYLVYR